MTIKQFMEIKQALEFLKEKKKQFIVLERENDFLDKPIKLLEDVLNDESIR